MLTIQTQNYGTQQLGECWEEYEKGFDASRGPWITQLYYTPNWDAVDDILNALMGSGLTRVAARSPEAPNLLCQTARAVGLGEIDDRAGGRARFNMAHILATFAIPPFNAPGDPEPAPTFPDDAGAATDGGTPYVYMEQSIDWSTEVIRMPDSAWTFQNDSAKVDTPVGKIMAVADFVVVRKWQSTLPYTNIGAYLMRLNSKTLFGQKKGLLQLRKCKCRRSYTSDGQRTQDVEYAFKYREIDHNMFFHPGTGDFEYIVDKAGDMVYDYADIGKVLQ